MATNRPALSVVLPTYNAGATLGTCLDSLLGQSFTGFEVIVFDDGSTDDTPAILRRYQQADGRVRVTASPHVGIVEGLRRACATARGEFIARMDADDVCHRLRFERQMAFMKARPEVGLCGTGVTGVGEGQGPGWRRFMDWVNGVVTQEDMVRELFIECPIPHPSFMMRREIYEGLGGYEDRGWPEDYDFVMRCYLKGVGLGKVDEPLLAWRHSSDRLSMVDGRYSLERFRALKRHYLFETHLKSRSSFLQWGAGEVGKSWLKEWGELERPRAVVDINPRKVGRIIHGTPVIAPQELPRAGEEFIVIAVGAPGAREEIRHWLASRGHVELENYLFLA